jgi:hypothetical protein
MATQEALPMSEQIVEIHQSRRKYQRPTVRERDLEIRNERLQQYVARLLSERVRIVICPECQAEREEVRR